MGPLAFFHDASWLLKPIVGALEQHLANLEHSMFVLSFTRKSDSLSQWGLYGDHGKGVALGFDLSTLRAPDGPPLGVGLSEPVVGPCCYDTEIQELAVQKTIKPLIDFAGSQVESFGPEQRVELIRATAGHVLVVSALLGGCLKHPGFVEEDEWRVLVLGTTPEPPPTLKTRSHKYGPGDATYVELPFGPSTSLPLTHVTLGPQVDSAAEMRIRNVFARYGHAPIFTRSTIPYRG
jgi:hypothetical protein